MFSSVTVAELIEELQRLPQDWRVFIDSAGSLVAEDLKNPKTMFFVALEKMDG